MKVILDTNFIISCITKKIDFMEQLLELGFSVLIPREVIQEMKDLKLNSKVSRTEKQAIDIALEIFSKKQIKKLSLGEKKVDEALIEKGKEGFYIATLDRGIKRMIPNRIVIQSAQRKISVERE